MRVRPRLVLIDCDHEESCSEEFVGPALMTGARVLLIRSARTVRDMTDFATRLGVRIVDMAAEHAAFPEILLRHQDGEYVWKEKGTKAVDWMRQVGCTTSATGITRRRRGDSRASSTAGISCGMIYRAINHHHQANYCGINNSQ